MERGFITLKRKITDSSWYGNPDYLALFIHMLLKANHKERTVVIGNQSIVVKRGQFISGRKALSAETGVQESKVTRILKLFKSEQQIKQQAFSKFSLFSIVNYEKYQSPERQVEQQMNNKRTASEQQMNTNNNVNNVNNVNKKDKHASLAGKLGVDVLLIERIVKHRRDIKQPANTEKKIELVTKDLISCVNQGFFSSVDLAMDHLDGTEWRTLKPDYLKSKGSKQFGINNGRTTAQVVQEFIDANQ